jgi:hypothetical protein
MTRRPEQRSNQRLKLHYPIQVQDENAPEAAAIGRTVTQNVAARGAYFSTFEAGQYRVGQAVSVVLSVPHRLAAGGPDVVLDLRGSGRVVRIEGPERHRAFGEDGSTLTGVAIEFAGSLTFQYRWI